MKPEIIDALAEYFTDNSRVVRHSINLEVGGGRGDEARDFFKMRGVLGITGYASFDEGKAAVQRVACG